MIVKKVRGTIVVFPSEEMMKRILREANVKQEEVMDVSEEDL